MRCGQCPAACHFHTRSGDARYTLVHKLEPLWRTYQREVAPFAPLVRALGLVKASSFAGLQQWQALLHDVCNLRGRCTLACPTY